MRLLVNKKIEGFSCFEPCIEIYDTKSEKPFYFKRNSVEKEIKFNLPKGVYETENEFIRTEPLIYQCPELPEPERNIKAPADLRIIVNTNPNKCSVAKSKGLIILDPSLLREPKPFLHFILFHEIGHYDYTTEWKCDLFSASRMLETGYNPSQCLYAQYVSLSEKQIERKKKLFDFLQQTTTL